MRKFIISLNVIFSLLAIVACSEEGPNPSKKQFPENGIVSDDGTPPAFSQQIPEWNGETATDGANDIAGSDPDIYHELNTFDNSVTIDYSGNTATVTTTNPTIKHHIEGAYVTIDFQSGSVSGVEIKVTGSTADGGLKIYGGSKFKLLLAGADIASKRGPAINSQCKKRMFIDLAAGTSNILSDCSSYTDDPYYKSGSSVSSEDRKGCLFSEGNIIFSGSGTLEVKGFCRHGIAADAFMAIRPGTTIAVTEAAKNCIHLKGDDSEGKGFLMKGGYLYCHAKADAGKAVKTDLNIRIESGQLVLNTSGDAIFDSEESDTSSPTCLKADGAIEILGGRIDLRSSGKGGKAISAGTTLRISDGEVNASSCGDKFIYSDTETSSPKAVKATGAISITGGTVTILSTATTDGAKGLESDDDISISGCRLDIYSYDDAINAATVNIESGSHVTAFSIGNDGIRGKLSVSISGGSIYAIGGSAPSCGLKSDYICITGGSLVAVGGKESGTPVAGSIPYRTWSGLTTDKNRLLDITDDGISIFSFTTTRSYDGASLLVADSSLPAEGVLKVKHAGKTVANNSY